MNGGDRIAGILDRRGVRFLFTLCGGHISPILVGARKLGIGVVDVRDEASAVFAADAVARLTGVPGVAALTAGPGVTNAITAVKNAQLAQSPVVILGGATGTILKGRGSLQDIDQQALFAPHVKWQGSAGRVRELAPLVEEALWRACEGVPGPVFVECPVDLLYEESLVRQLYGAQGGSAGRLGARALKAYLGYHVSRLFSGSDRPPPAAAVPPSPPAAAAADLKRTRRLLAAAQRPVLMIGSQATLDPPAITELAEAVERLDLPVYLSGMARGLLGKGHCLHLRHKRRQALKASDLVILAGVPCDFRLDYGRQIASGAAVIAVNRSRAEAEKNRRPTLTVEADPGQFLRRLADGGAGSVEPGWLESLRGRDDEREEEIGRQATAETDYVNPLALCRAIERALDDDSILVADGGDFVATASYITSPRAPLSWLDPGAFGTLGVGGGFALGARLCRPAAEVWLIWGDGSAAYSLAEFDTFVRHGLGVIAIVGNDASWAQIAREQVEILEDDVGTVLRRTDYHRVAEGYGGVGFKIESPDQIEETLTAAKAEARRGRPVLINALLGKTEFRKGSISM
jgi:acetolactate synthase-1/2/3 large subunit